MGLGFVVGGAAWAAWMRLRVGSVEKISQEILRRADEEAKELEGAARERIKGLQAVCERELEGERRKLREEEARLRGREEKLEGRIAGLEKREARAAGLVEELERVAAMSCEEARSLLLDRVEKDVEHQAARLTKRRMQEAQEGAEREAVRIITTAIGRMSASTVSESTVVTVAIPSEELKGRIIGREGRNIRMLEKMTGVTFVIDDTPGAVVLSSFDPIKRFIAKVALTDLIADGRIHPTRIEEAVMKARELCQKEIRTRGEEASLRVGALGLDTAILDLLGRLSFRTSYGQNILEHSLEVAHLMGLMASELGLDTKLARRIGLLHDMGKALSQEVHGSHAIIGHDFALKYGEPALVANGIGCHHHEMAPLSPEASLCSAADALSAARPGARIEAVEEYIRRVKRLEELAYEFPGIDKAYVLQSGREMRVIVLPHMIDDKGLTNLVRNLTKRIDEALEHPGKIKITALRETSAVEYTI